VSALHGGGERAGMAMSECHLASIEWSATIILQEAEVYQGPWRR